MTRRCLGDIQSGEGACSPCAMALSSGPAPSRGKSGLPTGGLGLSQRPARLGLQRRHHQPAGDGVLAAHQSARAMRDGSSSRDWRSSAVSSRDHAPMAWAGRVVMLGALAADIAPRARRRTTAPLRGRSRASRAGRPTEAMAAPMPKEANAAIGGWL